MKLSQYLPGAKRARFGAAAAATLVLLVAIPGSAQAATAVGLGTADTFVVLSGAGGITNTGPTTLNGDIGNFPDPSPAYGGALTINGTDHAGDGVTQTAKLDLVTAFNNAAGQGPTLPVSADLGGQTLVPGVYNQAATMNLSAPVPLTLDAAGNPNAVWVFQAASDLIVGSGASVTLINGAQACNVFWVVTSSATIGTGANFIGTVLALTSITVQTGATVQGRVLSQTGTVTLDTNTITRPVCVAPATPTPASQVRRVPRGAVSTGDGSTSGTIGNAAYVVAGGLALAGFGGAAVVAARRRRLDA
jgi:hypothetical protein